MRELPDGARIMLDVQPDGTTVLTMLEKDITRDVADLIGEVFTSAKQDYYQQVRSHYGPAPAAAAG